MKEAFKQIKRHCRFFLKEKYVPLRTNIDVPEHGGQSLYYAAYVCWR